MQKKKSYKRFIEIRSRSNGWIKVELLKTEKGKYLIRMPDGSIIKRKIGKKTRLNIMRKNTVGGKPNKNWGRQFKSKKRARKKKKLQKRSNKKKERNSKK